MKRALVSSLFVVLVSALSAQEARRPNILFLLADDLGYGDLGCYGNAITKTPNLDRLAAEGMRLTACYAASPNCSPARTGILTGRSPYRVGMYDFARFAALQIPAKETTVAELLRSAGYQTMFAGKWHCSGRFGKQPGPGEHGFDHWFANPRNFGKDPTGFVRNGASLPAQQGWMSQLVVDETLGWLAKRDKKKPFCAFLWFSEPHTPVVAAEEFYDLYRKDAKAVAAKTKKLNFGGPQVKRGRANEALQHRYYGCVSMLDHHIGRLLRQLDAMGLRENTVVVFTSDNGPEHRTPTAFGSVGPLRGAKGHMHDGGIRVPGIVRWPGKVKAGSTSAVPVNGTDYLPTFCALAGAAVPQDRRIDGANVLPAWTGAGEVARSTPMLWWLWHARGGKEVAMRVGDFKLLAHMTPQRAPGAIRDTQQPPGWSIMKFIKEAELAGFEMYDVANDPAETDELSKKAPQRFARLKARMIALHREIRDEGPVLELQRGARRRRKK